MFDFNKKERLSINNPRYLIGKIGIVSITILPNRTGQIAICGTWYSAICEEKIILAENSLVEVINIEGNTVWVKPLINS
jgi:membrane protein implicated in regulation of membrane protease activity